MEPNDTASTTGRKRHDGVFLCVDDAPTSPHVDEWHLDPVPAGFLSALRQLMGTNGDTK